MGISYSKVGRLSQKHDGGGAIFFSVQEIPMYFSHSYIEILTKVNNPNKLKEFKTISLINFISEIIFKLLSTQLSPILPNLIYLNMSCFFKSKSIDENIMLAHKITHLI